MNQLFKIFVNILLSVTFISIFIGLFFFIYGSYIEKNIVQDQSTILARDIAQYIRLFPTEMTEKIVNKLTLSDMKIKDQQIEERNKKIRKQTFIILFGFFIIGITSSILISKWKQIDFYPILRDNLIILFFIGIIEFLFITFVIQNIYLIDPNLRLKLFRNFKSLFII